MTLISTLRGVLIRPHAGSIGGVQGSNISSVPHTGFLVDTNVKIRQGVGYESTTCHRYYELTLSRPVNNT